MAKPSFRFGIGEWYGRNFVSMPPPLRQHYAEMQYSPVAPAPPCPFLSRSGKTVACWKKGGVCSLRMYEKTAEGQVRPDTHKATLRVTCPSRFEQRATVYGWIGKVLLGAENAVPIGQVNFLERTPLMRERLENGGDPVQAEEVGRIDNILIVPGSDPPRWCPVEIQAVYFSGDKMELEFASYRLPEVSGIVFPVGRRRPDYRSSGPKRLMPQLLVKVPTLRRWGKKMAVVVDEDFFAELGRMEPVADVSNCDVAWFVVGFKEEQDGFVIEKREVFLTTLENSQNGLVAARPVTKTEFEKRIMAKLNAT